MSDRSFDDLAERFAHRVYGGLKGDIRLAVLWSDLQGVLQQHTQPLRILDVGGGLGQLSIRLAKAGHRVVFNDLSPVMMEQARALATEAGVEAAIQWEPGSYQALAQRLDAAAFDLILCHAVLEWLQQPQELVSIMNRLLAPGGYLSLCFYNPAAKVYRNLIRGNFDYLNQEQPYQSDTGSLTPNHPCSLDEVRQWLRNESLHIVSESGVRVFHDYVVEKRGGHQHPDQVLAMELRYSREEPFKWLGRYLHLMACRSGEQQTGVI